MYPSPATLRTDAGRADQTLCWRRSDQEFFADGASHILAFAAASVFSQLSVVAVRRRGEVEAGRAIAGDGRWAFDHAGWRREREILESVAREEPGSAWELVPVTTDLGSYCLEHGVRDRHQFAHDPWWRAIAYLAKFPPPPVVSQAWRESASPQIPEQPTGPALVR